MTNRDAINILEEVKILDDTMYAYNPSYLEALDMALTALEAEETWYATHEYPPKTRWIPVSERLPDNDESVLISNSHGVTKAWWNGRCWTSIAVKEYKTVTAWMPLPEPYQEGKNE